MYFPERLHLIFPFRCWHDVVVCDKGRYTKLPQRILQVCSRFLVRS